MDRLTYELRQLCQRNRDGSHATQAERMQTLTLVSKQLKDGGFKHLQVSSLKSKHVSFLVKAWQQQGLSTGTLKNRLAHIRWWAQKVNKSGVVPKDNISLGVENRHYVSDHNKAQLLNHEQLQQVNNTYVQMSLMLQQAFGLRREEAIKFQPAFADRGEFIQLKGSWTKGGRERTVPVLTSQQREVLNQAHTLAGNGSLIPADKSYIQQRNIYDGLCQQAGLHKLHGLRHAYAQMRYETLTGWQCPKADGPPSLTPEQQIKDKWARQIISCELGHERLEVVKVYVG